MYLVDDVRHLEVTDVSYVCDDVSDNVSDKISDYVKKVVFLYFVTQFHSWNSQFFRAHRRVNGTPSMENSFQVAKLLFEVQKTSSIFCLFQKGPGVISVACIGLREHPQWSLRCARAFFATFWTFSPSELRA